MPTLISNNIFDGNTVNLAPCNVRAIQHNGSFLRQGMWIPQLQFSQNNIDALTASGFIFTNAPSSPDAITFYSSFGGFTLNPNQFGQFIFIEFTGEPNVPLGSVLAWAALQVNEPEWVDTDPTGVTNTVAFGNLVGTEFDQLDQVHSFHDGISGYQAFVPV